MPVKITVKAGSSNKTQTLAKTIIQSIDSQPLPQIDKLTIVIKPASEQDAYDIHSNIWAQFTDKSVFQGAGKDALKGYNRAHFIALQSTLSRPLIQYRYANHKAEAIRFDFNPRKVGGQGMSELHAVLISILPDGWEYVTKNGRITRVDVMVDLPGRRMDSFVLLPKQGLTVMEWSTDGHLESFRLGQSQGNQTVVYSVKKKRQKQGKPWIGESVVRIERRLRNPKPDKLPELPALKNPFAELVLCENLPGPPSGKKVDNQWSMFGDSVKVRGLVPALGLLPTKRRTAYRAHIKAHKQPWWDPTAIWASWPNVLKDSQLLT